MGFYIEISVVAFPYYILGVIGVEFDESFGNLDTLKEIGYRIRVRSGSCSASGSKTCREKMRRDRLNDRFQELTSILDLERPPKMDKAVLLADAAWMVTQLRDEAQKLRESDENLLEKINELNVCILFHNQLLLKCF